jgi:7,8-dihydroneopterin aldolase/epimerase/oxygenase
MALIELEEMEFFAHHGCFKEEQIIGNKFTVNFSFEVDTSKAEKTDKIGDTTNYQTVYDLIKEEMNIPSNLLEHVANRIIERVFNVFPEISWASVKVSKMNPPLGGKMKSVNAALKRARD